MGDPVRGGDGGLANQHHCLNCHGAPETQAYSRQNLPYAEELAGPGSVLLRSEEQTPMCKADCSAANVWPAELFSYQPDLARLPFWVRSNFEKALKAHRGEAGKPTLPIRMDVGRAEISIDLRPQSFTTPIFVEGVTWMVMGKNLAPDLVEIPFEVKATRDGSITSHWQVHGNYLNLGVQNMLRVSGVTVKVGPVEFHPNLIALDPSGQLHGKLFANDWGWQMLWGADVYGPGIPEAETPYYDDPHCLVFSALPQCRRPRPLEDMVLNSFLPKEIKYPDSPSIPQTFLLEDFILKLWEGFTHPKPPKAPSSIQVFSSLFHPSPYFLKPGSEVRVNLKDIRDFFIPGILDLGPSHGELIVQVDSHHDLNLTLEDLDLRLDALGLGFLKAKAGHLQPGDPVEVAHQGLIRPGLHLVRSTATGKIEAEVNLKVELEMENGGQLNAHLLFKGSLLDTPKGYQPTPDFFLALRDLDLTGGMEKGKIEIDSAAYPFPWIGKKNFCVNQGATLDYDLNLPKLGMIKGRIKGQGFTVLTPNEWGALDWRTVVQALDLITQTDYIPDSGKAKEKQVEKKGQYRIDLRLTADAARQTPRPEEEVFPLLIQSEVEHRDLDGNPLNKTLEGLLGHLEILGNFEKKEFRVDLVAKAEALNFPGVMKKGLFFRNASVELQVDPLKISKEQWEIGVPKLKLGVALNPDKKGAVQGIARLEQKEGVPFAVQWRPEEKQLKISGLDWKAQLEKVRLDNRWLKSDGIIPLSPSQTFGGDARLQIDFLLNMKGEKRGWNGEGKILLLGDERGEIYLTNSRGEQVSAPILRNTRWLFSKLHRVDVAGGYPLVDTELVFNLNTSALSPIGPNLATKLEAAGFGPEWYERFAASDASKHNWESGETQMKLCYDNQPLTLEGFISLTSHYFQELQSGNHPKELVLDKCEHGRKGARP